jgi:predicted PurR-regulated permease PerM
VFLGLEGRWGEAFGVAALGSLLVRGIENFLYPVLVRNRLKVPSVAIFIALVGGLLLFGWSGLVLGPVIMTVTSALLEICAKRFGEQQVGVLGPDPKPEPHKPAEPEQSWVSGVADLPLHQGK